MRSLVKCSVKPTNHTLEREACQFTPFFPFTQSWLYAFCRGAILPVKETTGKSVGMSEKKNFRLFLKSIPTATSPDARWGMVGVAVGFLLFIPPLALYFFEKGGILMLASWVWITFGIVVSIVWVCTLICSIIIFWKWWKSIPNPITANQIVELMEEIRILIGEIRWDRNEQK